MMAPPMKTRSSRWHTGSHMISPFICGADADATLIPSAQLGTWPLVYRPKRRAGLSTQPFLRPYRWTSRISIG